MLLRQLILALAGPVALLAAGAGLVAWVPELRRLPATLRLAWAYLAGAAAIGLLAYALSLGLGLRVGRGLFLTLALAGLGAALARRVVGRRRRPRPPARWSRGERLLQVLLLLATLGLLAESVDLPVTDFDGRMTWGTQARFLRHAGSVLPEALTDDRVYVIHPRYPPLAPLLQVLAVELPGASWEGGNVRALYALFLPALALVLLGGVRRGAGRGATALGVAALFLTPAVAWGGEGGARSTYSDLPLAAFLGGALVLLARPRISTAGGAAAGLLLAAAVLTKQEGAVLAGALALAAAAGLARRRFLASGAGWAATGLWLAAVAAWLDWRRRIPNRNDEGYLESLGPPRLEALADRGAALVDAARETLGDLGEWGLLALLLPFAALAFARGWRGTRLGRLALTALLAQVALAAAAYAAAPRADVIPATLGRFLVQAAPALAVLLALAARSALVQARREPEQTPE